MRLLLLPAILLLSFPRGAVETPVEVPLPAGVDGSKPWKLIGPDGKEVPVQLLKETAVWIHCRNVSEVTKGEFRLEPGTPRSFPKVEVVDIGGKSLLFSYEGKKILQYNYGTIQPPDGMDPLFARSGYIHPIWTPSGKIVTNDSPKSHPHHHGLWGAWTSSEFEGRKSDFWNSQKKQGKVEGIKVEETFSGPVFGGFRARHRFINLDAPGGPKAALDEIWEVRVYALPQTPRFLFDLVSTQTCATQSPTVIKEYPYGGIGFRGSTDWEGSQGAEFRTSEGKGRVDGHATKAKWCTMSGKTGDDRASVGFLGHPSNFRFPQPMRIHPDEIFFNWAVPQGGEFSIEPGKPFLSRYRFVIADGGLDPEAMEGCWSSYAEPMKTVTLSRK